MDQDLLEDLPLSLRNDVSTELYQDLMIKVTIFHIIFTSLLCHSSSSLPSLVTVF